MNIIKDNVTGCGLLTFALIRDDEDNLVFGCWSSDEDPEVDEPWVITRINMSAASIWSDRDVFRLIKEQHREGTGDESLESSSEEKTDA